MVYAAKLTVNHASMPELKIVTAPLSGTIADVKVAVGDSISEGTLLAIQSMVKVCEVVKAFALYRTHLYARRKQIFRLPLQGGSGRLRNRGPQ